MNMSIVLVILIVICTIIVVLFCCYGVLFAQDIMSGEAMTKHFEGFRSEPYLDTTGHLTVGYGFNLSNEQIRKLLNWTSNSKIVDRKSADIVFPALYFKAKLDAAEYVGTFKNSDEFIFYTLSQQQQDILTDMAYNLGLTKLKKFIKLRECIRSKDFKGAAREMKNSQWYIQTGRRARHHVDAFSKMEG